MIKYIKTSILLLTALFLTGITFALINSYYLETKETERTSALGLTTNNVAKNPQKIMAVADSTITTQVNPSEIYLNVGETANVKFSFDFGMESIRSCKLVIKYDPTILQIDSLHESDNFDLSIGKNINSHDGILEISSAIYGDDFISGNVLIADISITRVSTLNTQMMVLDQESETTNFTTCVNITGSILSPKGATLTVK